MNTNTIWIHTQGSLAKVFCDLYCIVFLAVRSYVNNLDIMTHSFAIVRWRWFNSSLVRLIRNSNLFSKTCFSTSHYNATVDETKSEFQINANKVSCFQSTYYCSNLLWCNAVTRHKTPKYQLCLIHGMYNNTFYIS